MRKLKWTRHADLAIRRDCSVRREDYLDHMTFERNVGPMFTEIFGPIVGLKEEWEAQGASPEELDFSAFRYRCPMRASVAVRFGWIGGEPETVIEDTDEYTRYRDALGRTMRLPKGFATLALPEDYPVRTMDDWLRLRPHYAFSEERFADGWEAGALAAREAGSALCVGIPGGYDTPRQLMGDAAACMAYYDQPELMHDILKTLGDTAVRLLDRITKTVPVDVVNVHEDMAGRSGPLAGPAQVREFIAPYYHRVWDLAAGRGARLFDQDSDGDMNAVIEAFLDAGINCMHPMEPAANMDVVAIRREYCRRLAFHGGLDKHVIRRGREEIVAELEHKIPPMVATGGCVLGLDHRIPNGTPLDNYRFYIRKAWEILEREAARL